MHPITLIVGRIDGAEMPAPARATWHPLTRQLKYRSKDGTPIPVLKLVKFAIEYGQKSGFAVEPRTGAEWGWMLITPAGGRGVRVAGCCGSRGRKPAISV